MKKIMDEKIKHRLVGIAVILAFAVIFAPAVIRKSGQVEEHFNVQVKLPPKPQAPDVAVADEKDVFKTIKITRVALPEVTEKKQLTSLVKAQPIQAEPMAVVKVPPMTTEPTLVAKEVEPIKATPVVKKTVPVKPKAKVALTQPKIVPKPLPKPQLASKQPLYAVQLASFAKMSNAQALVDKLRAKGYKANLAKIAGAQGVSYKVYAGYLPGRNEALRLKTQLAAAMQLNGFIVTTGVS